MNATQTYNSGSITATTGPFTLKGGKYLFSAVASSFGTSASLAALAADGSTYVTVTATVGGTTGLATLTANGACLVEVPPGQYEFVLVASFTACFCQVAGIPT